MRQRLLEMLTKAMRQARESADGKGNEMILPLAAYEDLYYAAFRAKRYLERPAGSQSLGDQKLIAVGKLARAYQYIEGEHMVSKVEHWAKSYAAKEYWSRKDAAMAIMQKMYTVQAIPMNDFNITGLFDLEDDHV